MYPAQPNQNPGFVFGQEQVESTIRPVGVRSWKELPLDRRFSWLIGAIRVLLEDQASILDKEKRIGDLSIWELEKWLQKLEIAQIQNAGESDRAFKLRLEEIAEKALLCLESLAQRAIRLKGQKATVLMGKIRQAS
ncbi:hypothetical protein HYV44_03035 [Candidatus Microgenomates bacterium]|nr:hypothetical protein [Candidatus Microgenomates bacterium]